MAEGKPLKPPIKFTIDGTLVIDATPEQDYSGEVEVTDHPIEDGANPTDHARAKPETFTATCVVSSVPVDETDRRQRGPLTASGVSYAQQVYQQLKQMKDDRQLHDLKTPLRDYSNMLITMLSSPTRAIYGHGLMFKIAFREIRIVQSGTAQFVTAPQTNTNKPTTNAKQSKKQGATPPEQRTTMLKSITNDVGLTTPGSGVAPP